MKLTKTELIERQGWTLEQKIDKAVASIEEFYNYYNGNVYVSLSGGLDSAVVAHIARMIYPDIRVVFCDTGLEYPEVRDFAMSYTGVEIIKPRMNFRQVIEKYGYPLVSKEQSQFISEYRTTKSDKLRDIRWNGNKWGAGKISKKWRFLISAPFKISHKCCKYLKKEPFERFEKETGLKRITGERAQESANRISEYLRHTCNAFGLKRPKSTPIGIFTHADVWEYIIRYKVPYSKLYDMGVPNPNNPKELIRYDRSGCMFCPLGVQNESSPNRFQKMAVTHPKHYKFCMYGPLKLSEPLIFMGIKF